MLFWSNELPLNRKDSIKRHLSTCDDCSKLYSDLQALKNNLIVLPEAKPERDILKEAIDLAHTSANTSKPFRVQILKLAPILCLILLVLLFMPQVYKNDRDDTIISQVHLNSDLGSKKQVLLQLTQMGKRIHQAKIKVSKMNKEPFGLDCNTGTHKKIKKVRSHLHEIKKQIKKPCLIVLNKSLKRKRRHL